jgi:chromosome segregation ATPase
MVGMMDGSARALKPDMKAEDFRKLVECGDGQIVDFEAAKPLLGAVTKEDQDLLGKLLKENSELASEAAKLLVEREKLVAELIRRVNPADADLDRLVREQKSLQRHIEELKEQIAGLREKVREK